MSSQTEQLIQQCKLNDQKAQMSLYKLYCKAMYNVALRMVHDSFVAEDIVQESFLSAFTDLDKLEDTKVFGSWLKRIVVYKSINYLRKEKKVIQTSLDVVSYKLSEEENEKLSIIDLKVKDVFKAINNLKDNYRLLLTLHYVEGYDYEEIVEITGLTYANCRTTISRAKESLRKKLNVYA